MAVLLTAKNICLDFPTKTILSDVTLGVHSGERIGIVGRNGDGKSTLLRILSRSLTPDSGQIIPNGSPTCAMLSQRDTFNEHDTVEDILAQAHVDAFTWEASREARDIVDALLGDTDRKKCVGELSGGQRRRVDLARVLMGNWDILMLDEPTNHLDIGAIHWLADHLKHRWPKQQGALLVVTHDRWFLDEVCESMWEVHDGSVDAFEGGYSAYIMQRVERNRLEQVAAQKRANQLRKELAWLSRGAQARRSKPKFHLEAAQALIADVPPVRNPIELQQMAITRLGKQCFELNDIVVLRQDHTILKDITWNIGPGDRIGLLGENGTGKSTFLDLLRGKLRPTRGHLKTGQTVKIAMLTQQLEELTPLEGDIVRVVLSRYKTYYQVEGKKLSPSAMLERLGFSRDELNARIGDLSGGQRRRLQLLLILLEEPNVLLLDEPGNDLDTDMLAVTEDLLDTWPGTLIVVSHDQYFIERVTDNQYALIDGNIQHVPGGVDEYIDLLKKRSQTSFPSTSNKTQKSLSSDEPFLEHSLTQAERHAMKKTIYSLERKMKTQRDRIDRAQQALDACDPYDYGALGEAQAHLKEAQDVLVSLEDEWLEASETLGDA